MDSDYYYDCSDDGYEASSSGNECKEKMSDNEDDDIAMEEEDQDSPQASSGNVVLTRDELQQEMNDMIKEATEIVEISPGAIRILLNHYKWNMENLLEKFYECSNLDTFLQRARVNPDPAKLGDGKERRKAECDICCRSSWTAHPSSSVSTRTASCWHFMTLTGKNNVVKKAFSRLTLNNFVESNRKLRWCPGTGCEMAVKVTSDQTRAVECTCKCRFCFECGKEWHEPMDCALLRKWLQKCVDDSETSNWISANTKDCPKCHTTIEKNGGCNHMTCKSPACTYEFCWICMGDWKAHKDAYNCSRYVESGTVKDSRAALEKYLHYYNRYMNHQNSLKLENKLYDSVRAKMDLMQRVSTMSWVEVQFLLKAVDVLSECRRTLMFAYAFAYYVKQGNELFIFEDNQRDLEIATEQLSGFLEQDLDQILQTENMVTLKQKVQDKYRYVEHRRNVLLNHCTEGAERDAWQFNNY
ncbi:hypothetical protein PRIPAC_84219 [Pristionchus pacificus]|uniref:RBR-type E3 ubiquitin transferase n=1 Tax=Pristionchus pacificus TaxID=54126 RepID=A0A2A6BSS4_PRIPA|nr:hypothetical protein PRIPAC_84219 [Pristionchus pacificus]|eukprot:PDM68938.1 hypothetical protein PRIPAC_47240 [Pristionchus pacificus]